MGWRKESSTVELVVSLCPRHQVLPVTLCDNTHRAPPTGKASPSLGMQGLFSSPFTETLLVTHVADLKL